MTVPFGTAAGCPHREETRTPHAVPGSHESSPEAGRPSADGPSRASDPAGGDRRGRGRRRGMVGLRDTRLAGRHPQDQARHHVMQENRSFDSYFGTYPGRRRHPDARTAVRGRACPSPDARTRASSPFHDRDDVTAAARTSTATRWPTSTAARWTGSSSRRSRASTVPARRIRRPELLRRPAADRRDGLPRRRARSRTTGPTRRASCCRTTCSSRTWVVEPAGAPLHGLRVVGKCTTPTTP